MLCLPSFSPRRGLAAALLAGVLVAGCGNNLDIGINDVATGNNTNSAPTTFVDPTATRTGNVVLGSEVYVGPFARLSGTVTVAERSNLQDNTRVEGDVQLGREVVVAHGATVRGSARLLGSNFVGFNALVDGAVLEQGSAVQALGRIGPGLRLKAGLEVLPGKNVTSQAEAEDPSLGKVGPADAALATFVTKVVNVNLELARGYAQLQQYNEASGIGPNPLTTFTQQAFPILGGVLSRDPYFRNRIIGKVVMDDPVNILQTRLGFSDSIRADEGQPITLGNLAGMGNEVTFHALEHTGVTVGESCSFGEHVVIHGGADDDTELDACVIGDFVKVEDGAVVFRSLVENGATVSRRALLDRTHVLPGQVIGPGEVWVENRRLGTVEW